MRQVFEKDKWYPEFFVKPDYIIFGLIRDDELWESIGATDQSKWRSEYELAFLKNKLGSFFDSSKWILDILINISSYTKDNAVYVEQPDDSNPLEPVVKNLFSLENFYDSDKEFINNIYKNFNPPFEEGMTIEGSSGKWGFYDGEELYGDFKNQIYLTEFHLFILSNQLVNNFKEIIRKQSKGVLQIKKCDASKFFKIEENISSMFEIIRNS